MLKFEVPTKIKNRKKKLLFSVAFSVPCRLCKIVGDQDDPTEFPRNVPVRT